MDKENFKKYRIAVIDYAHNTVDVFQLTLEKHEDIDVELIDQCGYNLHNCAWIATPIDNPFNLSVDIK